MAQTQAPEAGAAEIREVTLPDIGDFTDVEIIELLVSNIEFYKRERDTRLAAMWQPHPRLAKEDLAADVGALDQRLEDRIEQVLRLADTFERSNDLPRYTTRPDERGSHQRVNQAQRQNQAAASKGSALRAELQAGLERNIGDLKRENQLLDRAFTTAASARGRAYAAERIRENRRRISLRQQQIAYLAEPPGGAQQPLDRDEAVSLGEQIDRQVTQLRADFREFVRLKSERDVARAALHR